MSSRTPQPSLQRAIAGLVIGLCGVLWTVFAVSIAGHIPFPYAGLVLPAFGVLVTIKAWSSAVYHFGHVASQQRFAEHEFAAEEHASDRVVMPLKKACASCGTILETAFRFCPHCGVRVES